MDPSPTNPTQESPISGIIPENPAPVSLETILPSKHKDKSILSIIILVVILILVLVCAIGYLINSHFNKRTQSGINNSLNVSNTAFIVSPGPIVNFEPTPSPISAPISSIDSGIEKIPTAIEGYFDSTLLSLRTLLSNWDTNYIIDSISFYFGTNENDVKLMNKTGSINPNSRVTISVYSLTRGSIRKFEGTLNNLSQTGNDSDMSRYELFRQLSSTDFIPLSPKISVQKCINYAKSVGNYYLFDCSNIADSVLNIRFNWTCTFVSAGASSEYSQSFGSTSHIFNCVYDQSQDKVDWYVSQRNIPD